MNTPVARPISPGKPKTADEFLNMSEKKGEGEITPVQPVIPGIQNTSGNSRRYPYLDKNSDLKKTTTYRISEKLSARVEFAARRSGVSMTDLVAEALEKHCREIFQAEGLPWDEGAE